MAINKIKSTSIEDDAITSAKVADGVISAADVADGTITNAKLADGTIENAKLAGSIANDKLANSSITLNGTTVSLGGSANIGTQWQSVQTSDFTAESGKGYPIDTTSATITVTLPASPSAGDQVQLVDYAGTFDTNILTVNRNGENIEGSASNITLTIEREARILTYIDSTQGWVSTTGINTDAKAPYSASYLVIAGGGVGRPSSPGAGGAGGYRNSYLTETSGRNSSSENTLTFNGGTVYTVTVGAGGTGSANGSDSSLSGADISTITSLGGGYGGSGGQAGNSGGSGGGAGEYNTNGDGAGTAGQGFDGGSGNGGGGGAGGAGFDGYGAGVGLPNGGLGGAGLASSITGSSVTRASGGSAYYAAPSPTRSANVTGGGGGASQNNGVANTGGGGAADGGNGGSGVVILRMPAVSYSGTTTGSPTVTTAGTDTILTFTGSGSYTG